METDRTKHREAVNAIRLLDEHTRTLVYAAVVADWTARHDRLWLDVIRSLDELETRAEGWPDGWGEGAHDNPDLRTFIRGPALADGLSPH